MTGNIPRREQARPKLLGLRTSAAKSRRRVWQRWDNPEGRSIPAFLIGSGRSGTSMIVKSLAQSWQVELYNENNPAAFRNWRLHDLSTIEALIDRSYARLILFKPLKDTYRANKLLEAFPNARVVFVFRHYHDVINSARKRFYDNQGLLIKHAFEDRRAPVMRWIDTDFAEFTEVPPARETEALIRSLWTPSLNLLSNVALEWLFTNRLYFDLAMPEDERIKLIQYETIVSDPSKGFRSLCHFLGLPFEPRIVKDVFATSIKRDPVPDLAPQIQAECEAQWQRLRGQLGE